MSTRLGTLTLDLIAKTGGFTGPIDKARNKARKALNDVRDSVNTTTKAFAGLAVASAAATAALVADSARDARELKNLASIANTGVEDFQEFAIAAKTVGIEQDKLSDILKDTTDRVGDFLQTGGGPMRDFFENIAPQIGITADAFKGLSGREALQLYVDSLNKANLSQEDMTFYMEAIASDATALLPLLKNNSEELNKLTERAKNMNLVLSETEVESLAQLGDDFSIATKALDVFVDKVGAKLAPVINQATDEFFGAAEGAINLDTAATNTFESMIDGAAFVLDAVDGIGRVFEITANAMVVTFAGALDVLAGGAAKTLEIINAIPTVRLLVDDEDIRDLREFQRIQKQIAREGVSAIDNTLMEPLAGDRVRRWAEQAKKDTASLADEIRAAREEEEKARNSSINQINGQINAQNEYLKAIKETNEVLDGQQVQGLDGLFEQYLELAKSDMASGSMFLDDKIGVLKEIIQDQINNGESVDTIADKQAIVAQLENGQIPGTDLNAEFQRVTSESLEINKRIEENTRAIAESEQTTRDYMQLRPVNLNLPGGETLKMYGNQEDINYWERQFSREAARRGKR